MKIKELELPQDTKIYQLHFPSTFEAHPNIIVKGKADEKDNRGLLFTQSYKNVTDLQGAIAWYEFLKKNCPEEWLVP